MFQKSPKAKYAINSKLKWKPKDKKIPVNINSKQYKSNQYKHNCNILYNHFHKN